MSNWEALGYENAGETIVEPASGRELFPCDNDECRAFKAPVTIDEFRAALAHATSHEYLGGCSHGH